MSHRYIKNSGHLQGNYFCPLQGSLQDKVLEYESGIQRNCIDSVAKMEMLVR